jgi:tRNA(Ile)-lysidine synthase
VLVLAHHRDDQAETFLLRALRGSGVDGLGAMRPWRRYSRGWLWKPLLACSRTELLAYAAALRPALVEDPSNADVSFDRNFHAPARTAAVARTLAERRRGVRALRPVEYRSGRPACDEDDRGLAQAARPMRSVLSKDALLACPQRAARASCALDRGTRPAVAAGRRHRADRSRTPGRPASMPSRASSGNTLKSGMARPAVRRHGPTTAARRLAAGLDGAAPLLLLDGSRSPSQAHRPGRAVHRARAPGGERITLPRREHSHALKHVLQDWACRVGSRSPAAAVQLCGELLAAGDLAYSAGFDAWLRERGARLVWQRD